MNAEFIIIAEQGTLEKQALLLVESLRYFGGRHSGDAVTILQPRRERPVSASGLRRFESLGARIVEFAIKSACPEYGTSYRVAACAEYEPRARAEWLVFMDSDTVILAEPDLDPQGADVAARPVDVIGMCTTGAGDVNEAYWRRLCALCNVDFQQIPFVTTTVGRERVRASYNGGLTVVRAGAGLFAQTSDFFLRSVRADLAPWQGRKNKFRAGHGMVSAAGGRYWGSSQAALSLAITSLGLSVRELPASMNFPLHFYTELEPLLQSGALPGAIHVHYHHLLRDAPRNNPIMAGRSGFPPGAMKWLGARADLFA